MKNIVALLTVEACSDSFGLLMVFNIVLIVDGSSVGLVAFLIAATVAK